MTNDQNPREDGSAPTPEDLRTQARAARDELGRTVESLAATADGTARAKADELMSQARVKAEEATERGRLKAAETKAQAGEKVEGARQQAKEKAGELRGQVAEKTAEVRTRAREKTPDAVLEKASQAQRLVGGAAHTVGDKLQEHAPDPVRRGGDRVARAARGNQGLLVAGGVAAVAVVAIARHRRRG
ncbi:hypothetical protein [Streptomyces sp. NPDC002690]